MKDPMPQKALYVYDNTEHTDRSVPNVSQKYSPDLKDIQAVITQYVGQMVHGCGDATCKEMLCATGKRNTSRKPIRDYTPRSARAVAIALASGPRPRSRLCPRYRRKDSACRQNVVERRRGPSSFVQKLSDTPSIQALCSGAIELSTINRSSISAAELNYDPLYFAHLDYWHKTLDQLTIDFADPSTTQVQNYFTTGNDRFAETIDPCLGWLRGTLPKFDMPPWHYPGAIIGLGFASIVPFKKIEHHALPTWVRILDSANFEPSLRLFYHILSVIGKRIILENEISATATALEDGDYSQQNKMMKGSFVQQFAVRMQLPIQSQGIMDLIVLLKKAFLDHWNDEMVLNFGTIEFTALLLLDCIFLRLEAFGKPVDDPKDRWCTPKNFSIPDNDLEGVASIPAIPARLDAEKLAQSYMDLRDPYKAHLLKFRFLFTVEQRAIYFRTINHLKMRKVYSEAQKAFVIRTRVSQEAMDIRPENNLKYLEEYYLLLNVSRGNVLQDAFDQLWQRRRSELLRPLRVRLGEIGEFEIGHDLGGVQIEFFNLACKEMFREENQLFTTDPTTGLSYFCPGSLQPLYMFELCGLLFSLAMYNGIALPINFPKIMYMILVEHDLRWWPYNLLDGWPTIRKSLTTMWTEEVPGIEAVLPLEANGLRLSVRAHSNLETDEDGRLILPVISASRIMHHEDERNGHHQRETKRPVLPAGSATRVDIDSITNAWPGWHLTAAKQDPLEVTAENKHQYVQDYVKWLVYGSIAPQMDAFRKGFVSVIDLHSLRLLRPGQFQLALEGSTDLDIAELRAATTYIDYDPNSKYIQMFWRVVTEWPKEKQKQLLKFVTAIERIPGGRADHVAFKIERPKPDCVDNLPTSSTCFRTLFLPKYSSMEMLDEKLILAFKYGLEGFGSG